MATNALTADSKAPVKDVKRMQFGILSPDELVRQQLYLDQWSLALACILSMPSKSLSKH